MKKIKWLLSLADGKPLLFSIALLLIAVAVLSSVVIKKQNEADNCRTESNKRVDNISLRYSLREIQLNDEMKKTLNAIIEDYKNQLKEQRQINDEINNSILKNEKIISTAKKKIRNLK